MNENKLEKQILEVEKRVRSFNGKHKSWCESKGGFHCDCGIEEAERILRFLRFLSKNPQLV